MNTRNTRGILFAGLVLATNFASTQAWGQGFFGVGGDDAPVPNITLARAEIAVDVPTPLQGNDFEALLAQATSGQGISKAKDEAIQHRTEQLRAELDSQLRAFFADEEVALVASNDALTLHNFIDVSVVKQLSGLKDSADYELERGNLSVSGDFHFRIQDPQGRVLKEKRLNLADLRLKEKYQIKNHHDGSGSEDNTEQQLDRLMRELVERLLSRIDNDLEADSLQELVSKQQ